MKFLLVVLAVHLLIEWVSRRNDRQMEEPPPERGDRVIHPAEYLLRDM